MSQALSIDYALRKHTNEMEFGRFGRIRGRVLPGGGFVWLKSVSLCILCAIMQSEPAVIVRDLHKSYGSLEAVKGVEFQVNTGEVFGLLGPNGAGKTTTVEILEGLRPRSGGDVTVLGFDPGRQKQ